MNLLLMPPHTPAHCAYCQGVKAHLRKRQQHNYRKLLKLLGLTFLLLASFMAAGKLLW